MELDMGWDWKSTKSRQFHREVGTFSIQG